MPHTTLSGGFLALCRLIDLFGATDLPVYRPGVVNSCNNVGRHSRSAEPLKWRAAIDRRPQGIAAALLAPDGLDNLVPG